MTARRVLYAGIAVAAVVAVLLFLATPFPSLILWMAGEELFPATISWNGKSAWKRCECAIAGKTAWPDSPQAACAAMHLCANEVPLNETQRKLLDQAMRETKGREGW